MRLRRSIRPMMTRAAIAGSFLACACLSSAGCVREVLEGSDPEARGPKLSTDAAKNEVVVSIPWMQAPAPRLLYEGALTRAEAVYSRSPDRVLHFTLRSVAGTQAQVDVRSRRLPGDAIEFSYEIVKLPSKYGVDAVFPVSASGRRPACTLAVNGAPVALAPGTEVVAVVLSRDAATRIVVTPTVPISTPAVPDASPAAPAPVTGAAPVAK